MKLGFKNLVWDWLCYAKHQTMNGSPQSSRLGSTRKLSRICPEEYIPNHSADVVLSMPENELKTEQIKDLESEEKRNSDKKSQCKRKFHRAASYFQDYCGNTSLHGLKYMGEERRPFIERLCWMVAFGLSIYACSQVILKVWRKWEKSPVIVSFADSSTPVWQIPFPAVTICPEVKYQRSVFNFTYVNQMIMSGKEISPQNRMKDEYRRLLCEDYEHNENSSLVTDTGAIEFLQEVAPPCDDLFFCEWKGRYQSCCGDFFRPILTEEGVCYTFNMLATNQIFSGNATVLGFNESYGNYAPTDVPWSEWNAQDGYPKSVSIDTYPRRGPGAGVASGLHIYMKADPEDYDGKCREIAGFKVLLHNPSEFPRMSQQYFRAPLIQHVVVSVKPNIMATGEELQDYPSTRRRCLFQRERQLLFFTYYTQRNCELECLVNATLAQCECMQFFMPSRGFPICGSGSLKCIHNITEHIQNMEIIDAMKIASGTRRRSRGCSCLPACTELNYDAETSMGEFDIEKIFAAYNVTETEYIGKKIAKLSIFFKEWQFITSNRGELYGQTDFLASCGGLLGLFMGFSFLSLVEIFYYFTLRLYNNIRGQRDRNDSKNKNHYGESKRQ